MSVAGGWSDPTQTSLGQTFTYTRKMNGVNFEVTGQMNSKRLIYVSITANATSDDKKTKNTTETNVKNWFKNKLLPLINENAGTGTEVF